MLKLWKATVEVDVVIASDDVPDHYDIARAAEHEIADGNESCGVSSGPWSVESLDEIPPEWHDSLPRGYNPDNLTCAEILAAIEAARLEAVRNAPMPNQLPLGLEEA